MRTRAVLALACLLLSACGVRSQDGPEQLPAGVLPSELRPTAAASAAASPSPSAAPAPTAPPTAPPTGPATGGPATTTVTVYLVEEGRLVGVARPARRRAVADALDALLAMGEAQGPRRSAVPPGTVVERLRSRGGLLTIELSGQFTEVRGLDQLLAVAQLVWTATEFPPVREVDVLVGGRRIELPVDEGAVSAGPAGRADYLSVSPLG